MNIKIEFKGGQSGVGTVAIDSHQEAAGLTGMPIGDRKRFDRSAQDSAAVHPDIVIGKPAIVVPENP